MDSAWWDCFFTHRECEAYNGCSNYECEEGVDEPEWREIPWKENIVSFMDWLDCRIDPYMESSLKCGDLNGSYGVCLRTGGGWCEGIADPAWYDCFYYDAGCQEYNGCSSYACEDEGEGTDSGESSASFL